MKSPRFGCDSSSCAPRKPVSYHRKCFNQFDACKGNTQTNENVIIYVDAGSGNDSNSGDSPSSAMRTLDGAIARLGTRQGNLGIIQLVGTTEFVLPEDYVFDAREMETKYTRIIIKGTRYNVVSGIVGSVTEDHGPYTPTVTGNPAAITDNEYRWQTISASNLVAGMYNEKYFDNLTNGHAYTIKENSTTSISVLATNPSPDDDNDSVLILETGDKYQIFTIFNSFRFSGEFQIMTNVKGFVEFNGVRIIPDAIGSKMITPTGPPYVNFLFCEIYITFSNESAGRLSIFPGSRMYEGCVFKNTDSAITRLKNSSTYNTEYNCYVSCIFEKVIIDHAGFSDIISCWLKDSQMIFAGFNSLYYSLIENSLELANLVLDCKIGRLRAFQNQFIDSRPTGTALINNDANSIGNYSSNRIETALTAFRVYDNASIVAVSCVVNISSDLGRVLISARNGNTYLSNCMCINTSLTSTVPHFYLITGSLVLNNSSVTRNSANQRIIEMTQLSKIAITNLSVADVAVPTAIAVILQAGSSGYGNNITGINGTNQLRVGDTVAGGFYTQNDYGVPTTQNCSWFQQP